MSLVIHSIEELYQQHLKISNLKPDQYQQATVKQLQFALYNLAMPPHTILKKLVSYFFKDNTQNLQGIYMWGPVGRGKTMLMDLFCQCLDPNKHLRLHFHHFMEMIHQQLFLHSGQSDPLAHIAQQLSAQHKVICFDEFFVTDIGDAMLLGRLYKYLFLHGTFIVSTSNTLPENLYRDGLHRDRFTPAIKLINRHMKTIDLGSSLDHRHRKLTPQRAYFINNERALKSIYRSLSGNIQTYKNTVTICDRSINCIAQSSDVIWFDFEELCQGPRSSRDYIDLASRYQHILLSNVPQFLGIVREQIKARGTEDSGGNLNTTGLRNISQNDTDNSARRFISLIDELYDCRVNLFISATCSMEQLYKGDLLSSPFQRTLSRLHEMSSAEYQGLLLNTPNAREDCSASQHQKLNPAHDPV